MGAAGRTGRSDGELRTEPRYGIETGRGRVSSFRMMQPRVLVHGNCAVVSYFWRGSLGPDPLALVAFKETDVFVRNPGVWKLLHLHHSHAAD